LRCSSVLPVHRSSSSQSGLANYWYSETSTIMSNAPSGLIFFIGALFASAQARSQNRHLLCACCGVRESCYVGTESTGRGLH
jgi:hypothetical protein